MVSTIALVEMSPDDRLLELAAILATGVLRMRRTAEQGSLEIRLESRQTCLELAPATVLTGPTVVVNGPREPEIGGAAWN